MLRRNNRDRYVIGPRGNRLGIAALPTVTLKRWSAYRKAEVVAAVEGGLISLEEACRRYALTEAEFVIWRESIGQHGLAGLMTTRIQYNRLAIDAEMQLSQNCRSALEIKAPRR